MPHEPCHHELRRLRREQLYRRGHRATRRQNQQLADSSWYLAKPKPNLYHKGHEGSTKEGSTPRPPNTVASEQKYRDVPSFRTTLVSPSL